MKTLLLSCEVLRPELELLAGQLPAMPEIRYLEQGLHDYPERLRAAVQDCVDALERENEHETELTLLCGYGLCGRGFFGVHARRAVLVIPRVHDCIPLLMGCSQQETNAVAEREKGVHWASPGWLKYFLTPYYVESDTRRAEYAARFGEARAARMIRAEFAMLASYTKACHIRWPEMGDAWVPAARKFAETVSLEYTELEGHPGFLRDLVLGGRDPDRFLHLQPGWTIDMDLDGNIVAVPCKPEAGAAAGSVA